MDFSRPLAQRRVSRVHFDDEIGGRPRPSSLKLPTSIYDPHRQRWSVPFADADFGLGPQIPRQARYSEPDIYGTSPSKNYMDAGLRDPQSEQPSFTRPSRISRMYDHRGSDATLIEGLDNFRFPRPQCPSVQPGLRTPSQPLRSSLRRSHSASKISHNTRDSITNPNSKEFSHTKHRPRANSISTLVEADPDLERGLPAMSRPGLRNRWDSSMSTGSALLDADDPRVSGLDEKRDRERAIQNTEHAFDVENGHKVNKSKKMGDVNHSLTSLEHRQSFILRLAKALMFFGAPSHRIESQLVSVSHTLGIDAQFVHMPSVVICSFGDQESRSSETHFVKTGGRLMLGKLHNVHDVYRSVVRGHMDAQEGNSHLSQLLRSPPLYSIPMRCLFAFLCCFFICPMAFNGSLADAFIAGLGGALLSFLQLVVAQKNTMFADVFEVSITIIASFVARALSAIPGHVFCYQSISSSAVVLILPGYLILCSSLELASKNMLAGSVRMVYAIIYSLFLGFGLTIGSDVAFLMIPSLRRSHAPTDVFLLHGQFLSDNSTGPLSAFAGTFTFSNSSILFGEENPESLLETCVRNPHSVFLLQSFPIWTMFLLVPAYSLVASLWNLQPAKSRQLPVMVAISCVSYAANKIANKYIFDRSDIVSAIGAFVVGILGNVYSRLCGGTAFQVMSVGVSLLIPSGIAATGGLAQNYRSPEDGDSYSAGLTLGLRMVQVGIGITVGLFASGLVVYSVGARKKHGYFAF